jgi:OPA family sugar phosphate sensor protein UhpC-like MFS transporter
VLDVAKKPRIDANIYDADQLGTIGSCLLVAYAVGKLLNGFVADHVRVSRFLALGLGASALVNILIGFNTVYVIA